jgi:hypothetical protein
LLQQTGPASGFAPVESLRPGRLHDRLGPQLSDPNNIRRTMNEALNKFLFRRRSLALLPDIPRGIHAFPNSRQKNPLHVSGLRPPDSVN